MTLLSLCLNEREYDLIIVLDDANIERIKQYDPAVIETIKTRSQTGGRRVRNVMISYMTAEDEAHIMRMHAEGASILDVTTYLSRGFAYRPDLGDHDGPYLDTQTEGDKQ